MEQYPPTCLGRSRLEWAARPGRPPVEGQAIRNALRAIGVQQKIMLKFMSERRTYGRAGTTVDDDGEDDDGGLEIPLFSWTTLLLPEGRAAAAASNGEDLCNPPLEFFSGR